MAVVIEVGVELGALHRDVAVHGPPRPLELGNEVVVTDVELAVLSTRLAVERWPIP